MVLLALVALALMVLALLALVALVAASKHLKPLTQIGRHGPINMSAFLKNMLHRGLAECQPITTIDIGPEKKNIFIGHIVNQHHLGTRIEIGQKPTIPLILVTVSTNAIRTLK